MHNPPHPGAFIEEMFLKELNLSVRDLADAISVSPSTMSRVISGKSGISPAMAVKLSAATGRSARSWMNMQGNYDLWHAEKALATDLKAIKKLKKAA